MPDEKMQPDLHRRRLLALAGTAAIGSAPGVGQLFAPSADRRALTPAILPPASTRSVMERSLSRAGAVGDGKANDTAAIQEAVLEVERNTRFETHGSDTPYLGPGELVWPQGLFLVDDTIRICRSLRLRGEGQAEYSSGARIQQQRPGRHLFSVEPIAQGCSVGFSNMVLRANGGGGTGGALLRIVKDAGQCNSIRITDMVFATPQTHSIDITHGDDVLISRCLFDASGSECIQLGRSLPDAHVTNARIVESNFYAIASECIVLGSVEGLIVQSNTVFTERATRTFVNIHGAAGRTRNIVVRGNTLRTVDCLVDVTAADGVVIEGNAGEGMGAGVDPRRALVCCAGACSGVVVTGNRMKGEATLGLYDDSAATVTGAVIAANALAATAGRGAPIRAGNTRGRISDNQVDGATGQGVGHRWLTAPGAAAPGPIAPGATAQVTLSVEGAIAGDIVTAVAAGTTLPDGVVTAAHAAKDAVVIRYTNVTGHMIAVPAHIMAVLVTR